MRLAPLYRNALLLTGCPTIRTTNDMPIVDPQGFDALNLFPLQINPHFTNALPEGHKGETREQRIRELINRCFLAEGISANRLLGVEIVNRSPTFTC